MDDGASDEGVERIRQLSRQGRQAEQDGARAADADLAWHEANRERLAQLESEIPARLRQLASASDGDLVVEGAAFRSQTARAMRLTWRPGTIQSHDVELWLLRDSGSVEWRWAMGHREPPIIRRVPAAQFDLSRLDAIATALADPECWRGGHPPEV